MNQENTLNFPASGVTLTSTALTDALWIALMMSVVLLLSLFSGFKTFPVPFDLAWQFSPIGLLHGVKPENAGIDSQSFFLGKFGFTFDYLIVFLKTIALESPFYYFCFRREPFSKFLTYLVAGNLLTHPFVFFICPILFSKYLTAALVGEAWAAGGEMGFAIFILSRRHSWKFAMAGGLVIVLANLFSWEVGMFV